MSEPQTRSDNKTGIAEELAANQREISVAEFFEKNKHMLGFDSPARSLITSVKEAVDNALDATEEAGILPSVTVEISESESYYTLVVEDNGPGIPEKNVPKVFGKLLYGSRFGSLTQSRGQQGIGISAAVLYSQLTSGKPAVITSRPKGNDTAFQVELTLNTDTNTPEIHASQNINWDHSHGTRIELQMEANLRARKPLLEYIQATAVVNPHSEITFMEPKTDEPHYFPRVTEELPNQPEEIKPHPHGVELGQVMKMLENTDSHSVTGFLCNEFTRVGQKTADDIIEVFMSDLYGRQLQWNCVIDTDVFETVLTDAISRKDADSKAAFIESLYSELQNTSISHKSLYTVIDEIAEEIESSYGTVYGNTTQNHIHAATWELFCEPEYLREQIYTKLDAGTSERKSDKTVRTVAEKLEKQLRSVENHQMTKSSFITHLETVTEDVSTTFGQTAMTNILDVFWNDTSLGKETLPKIKDVRNDRDLAQSLVYGMQSASISRPSTKCLSPITPEHIKKGLNKEVNAEFYTAVTRDAGVHSGHPFVIEVGIAYGGDIPANGKIELLRYANRVPLVYQQGACAITQTIQNIGWRNYKLTQKGGTGLPDGPVMLVVHVASTNVPFTSESKDALASVPNIEHDVEQAVRQAARDLKGHLKRKRSQQKRRKKQQVIAEILPKLSGKLSTMLDRDPVKTQGVMARVMNDVLINCTGSTATISNFTNRSQTVVITAPHNATDIRGDVTVDTNDTNHKSYQTTIPAENSAQINCGDGFSDMSFDGIDDTKLTIIPY
jgi:DNA topoisomerase-6 subunit B